VGPVVLRLNVLGKRYGYFVKWRPTGKGCGLPVSWSK